MIHLVLIATGKVIIDVIPGVTQNISWTAVNLCYLAVRSLSYFPEIPPLAYLLTRLPSSALTLCFIGLQASPSGANYTVGPTTTSLSGNRLTAVHKTHPQENGSSPFPSACAFSSSLPSHRCSHDHEQFPAFDTLHELQPVAFCDQSISLNTCTCSKAAYGASISSVAR